MSIVEAATTGIIAGLLILIGFYIALRSGKLEEILVNTINICLEDFTNDEKLQKSLYTVGVLIGNGVKAGVGLQKRGGKMSLTDLIVQSVAGKFLNQSTIGSETVKSTSDAFKVD